MSLIADADSPVHVLTLTPFFPSDKNEVSGCFVAEPIEQFAQFNISSSVIAVSPIHYPRKQSLTSSAEWIRYPQLPGTFGLSTAGKLLYARIQGHVRKLHSANPIHVIHAHAALPCGHAAALLSKRMGIPFVVTVHGLDVFNTCGRSGVMAAGRHKISKKVYATAQKVICISEKVEEALNKGTGSETRSAVVYNGVDQNLFSPPLEEPASADPEILIVGNLLPSKGQELVLRAVDKLRLAGRVVQCGVIGEGPDRPRLEALVRELGIGRQVRFAGRKSRLEVAGAMRRCSVVVLPSHNEGLGCVYLEAMSSGKVAVGCRGQGIEAVIEHAKNGWLLAGDDVEELVQALSALLASSELRTRIGGAARKTIVERFTLRHQAQQLGEIYCQAIARKAL